jgi:hypothetical protein
MGCTISRVFARLTPSWMSSVALRFGVVVVVVASLRDILVLSLLLLLLLFCTVLFTRPLL